MMLKAIGMVELNSIAKAVETADAMIKAAEVNLIFSKAVCPGKFIIMVSGDVGAVNASVDAGVYNGGQFIVESIIIPNISSKVITAFSGVTNVDNVNAIGIMEFFDIASSVKAADNAVKTALVELMDIRLGISIGGKSYVVLTGDVSAVQEAIEAGIREAKEAGTLINKAIIPNPTKELFTSLL